MCNGNDNGNLLMVVWLVT